MPTKIYQVDAFTDVLFSGNPAAVCPLEKWPDDKLLQNIAMENNLAETAFYVKKGKQYEIRWFTPTVEVDLCGHATLAAAFVLFNYEGFKGKYIDFLSPRSGALSVKKENEFLTLNFPADKIQHVDDFDALAAGFSEQPLKVFRGNTDYMLVYETDNQILSLQPDLTKVEKVKARGIIVTAPGKEVDFVSRFFAPQSGIPEDPVTGSAHTTLTPYWSKQLGKNALTALQLSARGGFIKCTNLGERIEISGKARLYMLGELAL